MLPILLLAFALRVHNLDLRALWWDEGLSLFFAPMGYLENARNARLYSDLNPPFYRITLGYWLKLSGTYSAFGARWLSVAAGMLAVAAIFILARRLAGQPVAILAALLASASPALIYYAQEAKTYSALTAASLCAAILWLDLYVPPAPSPVPIATTATGTGGRGWRGSSCRIKAVGRWAGLFMCLLFGLGSQYTFALYLIVLGLWTVWIIGRRIVERADWKRLVFATVALYSGIAAVLLPFVWLTFNSSRYGLPPSPDAWGRLANPLPFLTGTFQHLTSGPGALTGTSALAAVLLSGTAVFGLAKLDRGRAGLLASWIILPLLGGLAFEAIYRFFPPRFLLYVVPALLILVARGLLRIADRSKLISTLILGAILIMWVSPLAGHYQDMGDPAEDWRPVAGFMLPIIQPQDAVLFSHIWLPGYFRAYLPQGRQPAYYYSGKAREELYPDLEAVARRHDRLWLLTHQTPSLAPDNAAGQWLARHGALVYDWSSGNTNMALFLVNVGEDPPAESPWQVAAFRNDIELRWQPGHLRSSPGQPVAVRLLWSTRTAQSRDLTVFFHLLAPDGELAGGLDSYPGNGLQPVTGWTPGETIPTFRGLLLPRDLPPGSYTLSIGLYDSASGQRVRLDSGADAVMLKQVEVSP